MNIHEEFVREILEADFPDRYQAVYDTSPLLQYLDRKMKAVHGDSKTRRSLANLYAVYSVLHFYQEDFYQSPDRYRQFDGYDYTRLFLFYRGLYGGSKLQNHALNSRVNGEFRNKFPHLRNDLMIARNGKYLLHIDYLYADGCDISRTCCKVIERYMELLEEKDHEMFRVLQRIRTLSKDAEKREALQKLLTEDAEARIFEIISYAVLKSHFQGVTVYFGYAPESVKAERLQLYRTGRTNANDGGIDFVMRPVGRFFQVTESGDYDKYLLDIDKVMHFPVTFVVKTEKSAEQVRQELDRYIRARSGGMAVIEENYRSAVEEIITIGQLREWIDALGSDETEQIIRDIDIYYRLEMNINDLSETWNGGKR